MWRTGNVGQRFNEWRFGEDDRYAGARGGAGSATQLREAGGPARRPTERNGVRVRGRRKAKHGGEEKDAGGVLHGGLLGRGETKSARAGQFAFRGSDTS